ncbi:hypothetical protein [Xylophilus sp. GOD-11R]|uniref:hypothetical protein n=1 Tax=Xylophilus sp. GOD-11R TaxID=3089814 RepID=UPI00298D2133|nr:hypothetical protein [Xylophilus sp. GOD-11R]WPB55583.1 hypothetical protein R9X41_15705 [Xylophilus sp. GOD-11R]
MPVHPSDIDNSWLGLIAWLYLLTNATRLVTYLPQIIVVWRCTDGARSVSVLTWGSWVLAQATSTLYGLLVLHDLPFVLISLINLVGCGCVTVIAMRRRMQWKRLRQRMQAGVPDLTGLRADRFSSRSGNDEFRQADLS